tara:strand:- start:144 stop:320 length:177 start_codon:yes stop_codon:yes gene_type:complete
MKLSPTIRNGILGGVSAILALISEDYISESYLLLGVLAFFFYSILDDGLKFLAKRAEN